MSKSLNSPTARLLQSSRLFSLPRALPYPGQERTSAINPYRESDTATLPYPIRQAVTTIPSSHSRGDWGLKRGLPSKATRNTGTPHIRIQANDTRYQITDFTSAADHTQTRAKWQEMGIPVFRTVPKTRWTQSEKEMTVEAYNDAADVTDPAQLNGNASRWKMSGPWIVGMEEAEFEQYVRSVSTQKQKEWREFMQSALLEERVDRARVQAQHQGEIFDKEREDQFRKEQTFTSEELDVEEKKLRDGHAADGLSSRLTRLMVEFLDLAHSAPANVPAYTKNFSRIVGDALSSGPGESNVPLSTHPGAGLSYMRSNAIMENHPLYGPQEERSPVLSRVLRFKRGHFGRVAKAKVGVGGVVADDPIPLATFKNPASREDLAIVEALDHESETGAKLWVTPEFGSITAKGTITLTLATPSAESVAVKTGNVEAIHEQRNQSFVKMSRATQRSSNERSLMWTSTPRNTEVRRGSRGTSDIQSLLESR